MSTLCCGLLGASMEEEDEAHMSSNASRAEERLAALPPGAAVKPQPRIEGAATNAATTTNGGDVRPEASAGADADAEADAEAEAEAAAEPKKDLAEAEPKKDLAEAERTKEPAEEEPPAPPAESELPALAAEPLLMSQNEEGKPPAETQLLPKEELKPMAPPVSSNKGNVGNPDELNTAGEVREFENKLRDGISVTKYSRSGKPSQRIISISESNEFYWVEEFGEHHRRSSRGSSSIFGKVQAPLPLSTLLGTHIVAGLSDAEKQKLPTSLSSDLYSRSLRIIFDERTVYVSLAKEDDASDLFRGLERLREKYSGNAITAP